MPDHHSREAASERLASLAVGELLHTRPHATNETVGSGTGCMLAKFPHHRRETELEPDGVDPRADGDREETD